jgi:hypothetical protein
MNFTTDLPKKRPYVTYIVASAVKCEKFFPDSKNEGPSFRMHAVILNKDGMQTQKYKSKISHHSSNDDHQSSLSTKYPSTADCGEIEKGETGQEEGLDSKRTSPKKDDKSYILCHIRKIDHNYKALKSSGKRRGSYEEEDEDEEEDPESEESPVSKRIVFEQNLNSQSKMEEEVKNFKENSLTNTLRHEPSLNPSKFEHNRSESIQSHSSAFHTINPMNNISFTFREKKLESNTIKSEIKSEGLNKKSETDSFVIKDTKSSQIKDKSESSNSKHKEEGKNKDISLLKDIYKENTENYDYFKLFNVLVNFKEN